MAEVQRGGRPAIETAVVERLVRQGAAFVPVLIERAWSGRPELRPTFQQIAVWITKGVIE